MQNLNITKQSKGQTCVDCALHDMCLPLGLRPYDLEKFVGISKTSQILRNQEVLFAQGDKLKYLYAVRSGMLKTTVLGINGVQRVTGFYLPGELVGLDGIYCKEHLSTASAVDTSSYCGIEYEKLVDLAAELPALHRQLLNIMSKGIARQSTPNLSLPADCQVAAFILQLSRRYKLRGYSAIELPLLMARRELASFLNITPETISRVFKRLKDNDVVSVKGKHLTILNTKTLTEIASGCN